MIRILHENKELYDIGNHKNSLIDFFNKYEFKDYEFIENPKKGETYYSLIFIMSDAATFLKKSNLFNNSRAYELYKNGFDIKFVICNLVECGIPDEFETILSITKNSNINVKDLYIINENQRIHDINSYGINVDFVNDTPRNMSGVMQSLKPIESFEWVHDKKYLFQCHNNINKYHRYAIVSTMKYNNILNEVDWSMLNTNLLYPDSIKYGYLNHVFNKEFCEKYEKSFKFILNNGNPKYSEYEGEYIRDFKNAGGEPDHSITYKENTYKNSYINIITESQYEIENTIHITEKTLIPFYFLQFPIFVTTPFFVKKLREMYNLDMFDDIINHSYDLEEDSNNRMEMISDEIKRLYENKPMIIEFYNNNKNRFLENQKIIKNIKNDFSVFNKIIDKLK